MDLFDYKPKMDELFDKDLPESIRKGQRLTTMTSGQTRFPIAPSKYKFAQHGKCGAWVSELLPWTAKIVDDLAVIKTRLHRGDQPRPGRHLHLHRQPAPRPAEPRRLAQLRPGHREREPAGLRRHDARRGPAARTRRRIYNRLWGSGFLPSKHQGVAPALQRRPGAVPVQPARRRRRDAAAACSTRWPG